MKSRLKFEYVLAGIDKARTQNQKIHTGSILASNTERRKRMGAIIGYGWYELLIYHPVKVHPVEELKADRPFNNSAVTGYPVGFV